MQPFLKANVVNQLPKTINFIPKGSRVQELQLLSKLAFFKTHHVFINFKFYLN